MNFTVNAAKTKYNYLIGRDDFERIEIDFDNYAVIKFKNSKCKIDNWGRVTWIEFNEKNPKTRNSYGSCVNRQMSEAQLKLQTKLRREGNLTWQEIDAEINKIK